MRPLGVLLLLVIGLGFGPMPAPASAAPCSFHTHGGATTGHETGGARASVAAPEHMGAPAPHLVSDHAALKGQFCCHVAAAVAPVLGPATGPDHRTAGKFSPRFGLPPWAAPTADIYRPPAFA